MAGGNRAVRSMTGFGAARRTGKGFRLEVEVRAVNHRFLQVKTRVPREAAFLEGPLEEKIRTRVGRGTLTVRVEMERTAPPDRLLDRSYLEAYARELGKLEKTLGIPAGLNLASLLSLPGVLLEPQGPHPGEIRRLALDALGEALAQMDEMRLREGAALVRDMEKRVKLLERLLERVKKEAPRALAEARKKLAARLEEFLGPAAGEGDPGKKRHQETAFLVDRMDFTEEIIRLESHLDQWRRILSKGGGVGKRLEFLLQEMGREINTLGSKAGDARIAHLVVELKSEAEKLKEQVQNLE